MSSGWAATSASAVTAAPAARERLDRAGTERLDDGMNGLPRVLSDRRVVPEPVERAVRPPERSG